MSWQFARFCVVGAIGFLVDFVMLELLILYGFTPAFARIYSIVIALQATFVLHRKFTFRVQLPWWRAWVKFMISNALGSIINYAIYVFAMNYMAHIPALLISTVVALFFNYWANKRYVFRGRRP